MGSNTASLHAPVRPDWLASYEEEAIDPHFPLIDAHHHLYDRPGNRYLLDEMLADIGAGHNLRASVYVQARAMYRTVGPEEMRPVGETEFANAVAGRAATGVRSSAKLCAAIVGTANLNLGSKVRSVLEAHLAAAPSRFRGIRHPIAWDADDGLLNPAYSVTEETLSSELFRAGFAELATLKLSFDAWLFFHQIPKLVDLARAFPDVPIALDHCGGILGIRSYEGRRSEVFERWSKALRTLASCPNVSIKLGGLGMRMSGFGFDNADKPPSSSELAAAWRPWMETCIDLFGTSRCMFESNFPVDKGSFSYTVCWNAMKRIAENASSDEKDDLLWCTAARFYRIPRQFLV